MRDRSSAPAQEFAHFRDFYPFYLSEHVNAASRRLHVVGTGLVLLTLAATLVSGRFGWLFLLPVVGYGPAWIGHFSTRRIGRRRSLTRSTAWWAISGCSQT